MATNWTPKGCLIVCGVFGVTVLAGLVVLGGLMRSVALQGSPDPLPAAQPPSHIPESLAAALELYGPADITESTENDKPRPPIVTRLMTYNAENVRLVFVPDRPGAPPYKDWRLVMCIDPTRGREVPNYIAASHLEKRWRIRHQAR